LSPSSPPRPSPSIWSGHRPYNRFSLPRLTNATVGSPPDGGRLRPPMLPCDGDLPPRGCPCANDERRSPSVLAGRDRRPAERAAR
jgi:hypothetical protein